MATFDRAVQVFILLVLCGIFAVLYRARDVRSASRYEYKLHGSTFEVFDRATGSVHYLVVRDGGQANYARIDAINGSIERRVATVRGDNTLNPWDVVPPPQK
jgi:hypothetical protein